MLTDGFAKQCLDIERPIQCFNAHLRLGGVGTQRDGVAVAVVDNCVVLAHRPADHRALHLVTDRQGPQVLSLLLEYLRWDQFGGPMHLGVGGPLQPLQAASVEDAIVHIQPVAEEIPLDVLHHILNFSFALRVRPAAHSDGQTTFLPELLKLIGVDDVPRVFTYAYNAVLVEYQLLRHPAHVLEAIMADPHKVYAGKGTALLLCVLVPRPGQHKRRHIHPGLPAVYVGHHLLPEVHLHLLPHRQLRHRLIFPRRHALFQPVFFPQLFHIPGYRSLAHLLPVVFPQARKE